MAKKQVQLKPAQSEEPFDFEAEDLDAPLTPEEQAEVDAIVAEVGKRDPNDTEEDYELDSLPELDDEAEVVAVVIKKAAFKVGTAFGLIKREQP